MSNELTTKESGRLSECERIIEKGVGTFVEVGNALAEIRESKLYRASHSTFESYCQERWGFTKRRANQLIEAAGVAEEMGSMLPKVSASVETSSVETKAVLPSARAAEAVARVPKSDRAAVVKKAAEGGKKVTAKAVKQAAKEVAEAKKPASKPPQRPKDGQGEPIPADLIPIFKHAGEFERVGDAVHMVKREVEKLGEHPSAAHMDLAWAKTELNKIARHIKKSVPHAVCPSWPNCKNGCEWCKDCGYLTAEKHDRMKGSLR